MDELAAAKAAATALREHDERRTQLLAEARSAVATALRANISVDDLAEETGWHRNTIGAIRKEYGLPDARRHNKPPRRNDTGLTAKAGPVASSRQD